jgi:hypothetical protein
MREHLPDLQEPTSGVWEEDQVPSVSLGRVLQDWRGVDAAHV